jgi:hypothetical protein
MEKMDLAAVLVMLMQRKELGSTLNIQPSLLPALPEYFYINLFRLPLLQPDI